MVFDALMTTLEPSGNIEGTLNAGFIDKGDILRQVRDGFAILEVLGRVE